jgi:NADPH2:quinone reductase
MCKELGTPDVLTVEDVDPPKVGSRDVRIRVEAAGCNFPDVLVVAGKYQVKPPMPFTPGLECAGEVLEVGDKVSGLKVGDRVMGTIPWGGYAQEAVLPMTNVIPMTGKMDFTTGAGFLLTYGTSYHALVDRAQLKSGETLLVLGAAGGVGLTAVEIGKALGARVIAAASSAEKLAVAKEHGADELIDYTKEDLRERVKALTDGQGADVIYDPVGGDIFDTAIRVTAWEGRYLIIGFAAGRIPELPVNLTLVKGFSVVGVFWGSFAAREPERNRANFQTLMDWYDEGRIKPLVSKTYSLNEAPQALRDLAGRRATGKLVVLPQQ